MPGKKGNKNALKHGIFSKFIAVVDDKQMAGMSGKNMRDELAVARVQLADGLQKKEDAKTLDDYYKADTSCLFWMDRIAGMISRDVEKRETETAVFTSLLDAVRAANDKQNVLR